MSKIVESRYHNNKLHGYLFYCPGCKHAHVYDDRWKFNGNMVSPSFTPSLLHTVDAHPDPKKRRCHLYVTDGKIQYTPDCSHDLAGQTVDIPDWEQQYPDGFYDGAKDVDKP